MDVLGVFGVIEMNKREGKAIGPPLPLHHWHTKVILFISLNPSEILNHFQSYLLIAVWNGSGSL